MENINEIYKKELSQRKMELAEIEAAIKPFQEQKERLQKDIAALNHLLGSGTEGTMREEKVADIKERFFGKTGKQAYMEIAKKDFLDKPFREAEIREYANKEGLKVKGKPIQKNYSRAIIVDLSTKKFLKRAGYGLYMYNENFQKKPV